MDTTESRPMNREAEIFADALALPPAERSAYLDRKCQGDSTLRARIESLLAAHGEAGDFLKGSLARPRPPKPDRHEPRSAR